MSSNRSSNRSNNQSQTKPIQRSNRSKQSITQSLRLKINKKLANKYCTCQNYITINQINRTIIEKQCILKTTVNDIKFNNQQEKLQSYYSQNKSIAQLPQLIEYYKYYSQKSVLFIKEFFPLLYQYQEKRKVIEYNRLKFLLNLSDSESNQIAKNNKKKKDSFSRDLEKSKIGISRNYLLPDTDFSKIKGYKGINILDQLEQTQISAKNQHQQSILINRLRNNLSKHIGSSHTKNLTLEELDKKYDFLKKNDVFHSLKSKNNFFLQPTEKGKSNPIKSNKFSREQTHTNTPDDFKNSKGNIRRRSAKRNNSCQNLMRSSAPKNPYESYTSKIRRKKNLSMDNLCTHTSTPYANQQRSGTKMKRMQLKTSDKQRYLKQKQSNVSRCPQNFMESISDLKNKIKRQKQILLKNTNFCNFSSLKRQKKEKQKIQKLLTNNGSIINQINTANQRFTKKNYEKLRQKTVNNFH